MIHPSQAFFLDLPQQKNGIRQKTSPSAAVPSTERALTIALTHTANARSAASMILDIAIRTGF
jgi:hypothetical protein